MSAATDSAPPAMALREEDEVVSDGDPPFMSASPSAAIDPSPMPPHEAQDPAQQAPARFNTGSKRSFDELEGIVFSNPRSFVTLAGQIAEARNVELVVSEDRTHKVSSAYMHVTCSYRKAGSDSREGCYYRCRHPLDAQPDITHGSVLPAWLGKTTSGPYPESSTRPRPAQPRARSASGDSVAQAPEALVQVESLAGKAPRVNPMPSKLALLSVAESERALAPPFIQRGIELQSQIVPALGLPTKPSQTVLPPVHPPTYFRPTTASPYQSKPQSPARQRASQPLSLLSPYTAPSAYPTSVRLTPTQSARSQSQPRSRQPSPSANPSTVLAPVVALADPVALPEWLALLHALGDPLLLPLATFLASPAVSCTPTQYFAEDEKLQQEFLGALPDQSIGLFPKLKFGQLMKERGKQAWSEALETKRKNGDTGTYVSGVKRSELPNEIPPSRPLLSNGTARPNAHSRSPSASSFTLSSRMPQAITMDVDPSPTPQYRASQLSTTVAPTIANPPPPPGAAKDAGDPPTSEPNPPTNGA
ncbi:hypothetical protein JCM11641_000696 [Rhodosporidiobolus odoratus]